MNGPLDHDACWSALGHLLAGELDERTAARTEEHLVSCADCRAELDAARALHELRATRLTQHERRRLHARVHELARSSGEASTTTPRTARRRLGERLVPALAAAAVLAVIGVGAASILTGVGGSDDAGSGGSALESQVSEGHSAGAGQGETRPQYLGDVGAIERGSLLELTSRPIAGRALGASEGNLSAVDRLTKEAPAAVASQIRRCLAPTADRRKSLRPSFAATGRLEDRRVVVIGFRIDATDRYSVWTWARGECGAPLLVESGSSRR